jgi:glucose/arabinose dehydrogenase
LRFIPCFLGPFALAAPLFAQTLRAVRVAEQIPRPTFLCSPPGDTSRLFLLEGRRGVRILRDGVLLPTPFLDISAELTTNEALAGMAFHPDYASNGRFFLAYLDKTNYTHLVGYTVSSDPDVADPASRTELLPPILHADGVHNWNCLEFGPDGKLYLATGDAVSTTDDSAANAQDLTNLLGKILRLDVDLPPPYVPPDNPLVGRAGVREEIWQWGLRNPWRFSFDAATGDLYVGDVGWFSSEEVDFLPAGSGGGWNFGWPCLEGSLCRSLPGCSPCDSPRYLGPILEYGHAEGECAIIAGPLYRGSAIPGLDGTFFFADYCTGRIWSMRYDGQTVSDLQERTQELVPWESGEISLPTSFGVDAHGEMYLLDNSGGEVYAIVAATCEVESYCVAAPNSSGPGATIASSGSTSISAEDFVLEISGGPPGATSMFFYGSNPTSTPFGDGFLCVDPPNYRLRPPLQLSAQSTGSYAIDYQNPPLVEATILAGSTWCFQCWYRDPAFGGTGFNTTDGLRASFCP